MFSGSFPQTLNATEEYTENTNEKTKFDHIINLNENIESKFIFF